MSQSHTDRIWSLNLIPDLKLYLLTLSRLADDNGECVVAPARLRTLSGHTHYTLGRLCKLAMAHQLIDADIGRGGRPTAFRLTLPGSEGGRAA